MASKKQPARDVKMPKNGKSSAKSVKKSDTAATNKQKQENLRLKEEIRSLKKNQNIEKTFSYNFMPYILCFAGIFLTICFIMPEKMNFIGYLAYFLNGLFSLGAIFIPVCMVIEAFLWKADAKNNRLFSKFVIITGFIASVSSFFHLFATAADSEKFRTYNLIAGEDSLYFLGMDYKGGGIIGGLLANFVEKFTGVGAWIIFGFLVFLLAFAAINITPIDIIAFIRAKVKEYSYNSKLKKKEALRKRILEQNENDEEETQEETDAISDVQKLRGKKKKAYLGGIDGEDTTAEQVSETVEQAIKDVNEIVISPDAVRLATGDTSVLDNKEEPAAGYTGETIAPNKDIYDSIKEDSVRFTNNKETEHGNEKREIDLSEIFTDDAVISSAGVEANTADVLPEGANINGAVTEIVTNNEFEGEKEDVKVQPKPKRSELYRFPSIELLQKDPNPATFSITEELKSTAVKLVEILANFGVKTKITNICCGPTVTRYELQPEIGVRVKSIQNLSDDIALHLAAAGVRIEAPIPGKDAVGIEIPNKTVSTVYIRNLIENPKFAQLKSRLSVGLGMDVAGSPVYMDIAKMPHLLIAGATGMGKSVCINSFIVSLLYKARPDECKLLLIDPKKVEFAPYNGMPHLIVPVVSDPKKAAGSLSWAVNEMERRFQLIEEVGVRNIDEYNKITEKDPEKEHMPKIVIIIDELADLMMTARDSVENSICRIAQKARAAGMHLVIGTQRPSVDVITGLIKANVPSRIACTVASQTDSRTILDMAGAEKLLGKGDMLYAPVGCMKPIRVQGSFVDNEEIEEIISFLKSSGEAEYDNDIIHSIEREAEHCGEKRKGKSSGSDGDDYDSDDRDAILNSDDAMFPAIEIAVDANMISTSLLQRKLSLGYSRAARIVDKLEKIGIVGPYEGSKPRKVLITRQEYLEMKMNRDE